MQEEEISKLEFGEIKMSIFTKIVEKYDWKIIGEPVCLSGGFMHKMYKISTQQGTFALKLLRRLSCKFPISPRLVTPSFASSVSSA